MEYLALNNGGRMPLVGFGTWTLRGSEGETCVREALDCGRAYVRPPPEREKQVYLEGDAAVWRRRSAVSWRLPARWSRTASATRCTRLACPAARSARARAEQKGGLSRAVSL